MANLAQGWINHLRRQARNNELASQESQDIAPGPMPENICSVDSHYPPTARARDHTTPSGEFGLANAIPARKRLKSPIISIKRDRTRSPSPYRRSRTDQDKSHVDDTGTDFPARPPARNKGRLWNEGDPIPTRNQPPAQPVHSRQSRRRDDKSAGNQSVDEEDPSVNRMIWQPETRPISQEQLVAEVKGIYAGLVMVESKCIAFDTSPSAQNNHPPKLTEEQWQALIALHRTLLHEHHDFSLASQHPSASPALRTLASKYAMPEGMRPGRQGAHWSLSMVNFPHDAIRNQMPEPALRKPWLGYTSESIKSPRRGKLPPEDQPLPPEDWSLPMWLMPLFAGEIFADDWSGCETLEKDERGLEFPIILMNNYGRTSQVAAEDRYSRRPGCSYKASQDLESSENMGHPSKPGCDLLHILCHLSIPPRLLWLAFFMTLALPGLSAGVGPREWTLGAMAVTPSFYYLTNELGPSEVYNGVEEIMLDIARAWGVSVGAFCAAWLANRLRTYYPPEKQRNFTLKVLTLSLIIMFLLLSFMRDKTFSIFDLLAVCLTFCTTLVHVTSGEFSSSDEVSGNRDVEMGNLQPPPASNQPNQPPHGLGGSQIGGANGVSVELLSSAQEDDRFSIGDSSTAAD